MLQHLLHPGPRRGRPRGRQASRCSPGRARRWRSTGGAPSRRCAGPPTDGRGPNMILDDGGDATLLVHLGVECERDGNVPELGPEDSEEYGIILATLNRTLREDPKLWTRIAKGIKGVTEETTTGVHRLYQRQEAGTLLFPAINVNDSVTKSQVRQPLRVPPLAHRRHLPGDRRDDRRQDLRGRAATATSARGAPRRCEGQGARVIVTEIDPICALQAAMEGYQVLHPGRGGRQRRHLRHRHRQPGHHHRRGHGPDEAQRHRRQHRPLRQRDRHGRAGPLAGHHEDQHQAPGRQPSTSPTATR